MVVMVTEVICLVGLSRVIKSSGCHVYPERVRVHAHPLPDICFSDHGMINKYPTSSHVECHTCSHVG